MRLFELSLPKDTLAATNALKKAGYEHLDIGSFADVFHKTGKPYILKLFISRDEAYLEYLKLVTTHSNPHFPKIIGKPIRVTDAYYAIRIEKLEPYRQGPIPVQAILLSIAARLTPPS